MFPFCKYSLSFCYTGLLNLIIYNLATTKTQRKKQLKIHHHVNPDRSPHAKIDAIKSISELYKCLLGGFSLHYREPGSLISPFSSVYAKLGLQAVALSYMFRLRVNIKKYKKHSFNYFNMDSHFYTWLVYIVRLNASNIQ